MPEWTVLERVITAADVEDDTSCGDTKATLLEKVRACRRLVQRWLDPPPTDDEMATMPWTLIVDYQSQIDQKITTQLLVLDAKSKATRH